MGATRRAIAADAASPTTATGYTAAVTSLPDLPPLAAWRHLDARDGFEVVVPSARSGGGVVLTGRTTALEDGLAWHIGYRIEVDDRWRTRRAEISAWWPHGEGTVLLEADGEGRWSVDGAARPDLDGVIDVDLECSACTNTFPLHRLDLATPQPGPAAYVNAPDLSVMRLEQTYGPARPGPDGTTLVGYDCAHFTTTCDLTTDAAGLVLDYPGLAVRTS